MSPTSKMVWQKRASKVLTLFFIVANFIIALEPFRSKVPWMTFEEDDFFYYLKVAQNLAHGAGSTYNGLVATNGYHPLWFLILTGLSWFSTNPEVILFFVVACAFCATMVTYVLARKLIASTGIGDLASTALAIYIAVYSSHIYFGGMEVVLTVPFVLFIAIAMQRTDFWLRGLRESALFGLLLCIMVLSRLDTAILVAMLGVGCLTQASIRSRLSRKNIYGFVLGFIPFFIYVLSNKFFFGIWMPVSGMAKQQKFNHWPAKELLQSAIDKPINQLMNYVPVILAFLLFPLVYKKLTEIQRIVYASLLLFPFVYIFILSCTSDWRLFNWYYYPFRIALCIAFILFCLWVPSAKVIQSPVALVLLVAIAAFSVLRTHRDRSGKDYIYASAVDIRHFAESHPGVYAMGDYAGKVGYILPYPLVQTEGLMMDKNYVSLMRQQMPLREALAHYNVHYYMADVVPYSGACYHADEPIDAGPSSPHMRGVLCQAPVATFHYFNHAVYIFDLQSR